MALAIRLFVVITRTVSVTFKGVKLGRYIQRSQAIDRKPCGGGKVGNCGFNKDRFRYVAEERNFATANVGSWPDADLPQRQLLCRLFGVERTLVMLGTSFSESDPNVTSARATWAALVPFRQAH